MDIKDFQENIDGAIKEILKLIEKKINDNFAIERQVIFNNINHQIRNWEIYVDDYISNSAYQPINKYDIDIINMILYIIKLYGKLVLFYYQQDNSLFMKSFTTYKEDSILYKVIYKINSQYKLNNFNCKKYSKTCNELINNIIEYIQETVINYQIKSIIN